MTRPDSAVNVYLRLAVALLADAERELAPADLEALLAIAEQRVAWIRRRSRLAA